MVTHRALWFVRHGERIDNVNPEWKKSAKRWDDPHLSKRGYIQAEETGKALQNEDITIAICSPFTRCVETITGILKYQKKKIKVFIEPGLGESLNACNDPPGRPSIEEIMNINPNVDPSYVPIFSSLPPEYGGDTGCCERIDITVSKIIERFPTGNVLMVSHGSPIAACHLSLMQTWRYVGLCTIGKVVQEGQKFSCHFYGCMDHLSDKTNLREVQCKGAEEKKKNEITNSESDPLSDI